MTYKTRCQESPLSPRSQIPPHRRIFPDPYVKIVMLNTTLSFLCHTALWPPVGEVLTSWLSCMWCFLVYLFFSHTVSWVRYGTLHRFLIVAFFPTVMVLKCTYLDNLGTVQTFSNREYDRGSTNKYEQHGSYALSKSSLP